LIVAAVIVAGGMIAAALLIRGQMIEQAHQSQTQIDKAKQCADARKVAEQCRANNGEHCEWWFQAYMAEYCKGDK